MIDQAFQQGIRERLLKEQERLEYALGQISKTTESGEFAAQWEDFGQNEEDNAAEVDAFTNSLGVGAALEQELDAVKEALSRIEGGTYGICARCQQEISSQRLDARPQSKYCVPCLQALGM